MRAGDRAIGNMETENVAIVVLYESVQINQTLESKGQTLNPNPPEIEKKLKSNHVMEDSTAITSNKPKIKRDL